MGDWLARIHFPDGGVICANYSSITGSVYETLYSNYIPQGERDANGHYQLTATGTELIGTANCPSVPTCRSDPAAVSADPTERQAASGLSQGDADIVQSACQRRRATLSLFRMERDPGPGPAAAQAGPVSGMEWRPDLPGLPVAGDADRSRRRMG